MEIKKIYKSDKINNIGILGGTFDPPHFAHLHMADKAAEALDLDAVIMIPSGIPPHKDKAKITRSYHRIKMLELLICDRDNYYIDDTETKRNQKSYTLKTIKRINRIKRKETNIIFIIGADSLMFLDKWYRAKKLLAITEFAVIPRANISKEDCDAKIKFLERKYKAKIIYVDTESLDISSTHIRETISINNSYSTSIEIQRYIKENGLYNDDNEQAIIEYLKANLDESRYQHSISTAKCAVQLAERYNAIIDKAKLSALLHDCSKCMTDDEISNNATEFGFIWDEFYKKMPSLAHGFASANIAKKKFGIKDEEMLDAICYHTITNPDMSDLAKIVYIADKIEGNRTFGDIWAIRENIEKNQSLDNVFLLTLKRVEHYHVLSNKPIHPLSIETYNHIASKIQEADGNGNLQP